MLFFSFYFDCKDTDYFSNSNPYIVFVAFFTYICYIKTIVAIP